MSSGLGVLFYSCSRCELIFKEPSLFQSFDIQKERYDLHHNLSTDLGYRKYFQYFLDFVMPLLDMEISGSSVLDWGCGRSRLLCDMMEELGMRATPYDPIYHPDITINTRYKLVTSVEVFEHLHDPLSTMKSITKRVDNAGMLAIRTEFHPPIQDFNNWYYPKDPTHILFYTPKTFRILCDMFGYEYISDNGKNIILVRKIRD